MAKFVVDSGAVLELVRTGAAVAPGHRLLAPTLIRSQTLSALYEATRAGELERDAALELLKRVSDLKIRLLGDLVLRRTAWTIAEELGWPDTYEAEYLALTRLQGDAFVTVDADLARRVKGVVPTATLASLRTA